MDINKQHLIDDIKYFEEQENFQIMLRDSCEKGSVDYTMHQKSFETYFRAHTAFRLLLDKANKH